MSTEPSTGAGSAAGTGCRQRLADAAAEVVDYRGRQGLSSAQELRSMLADAMGSDSVRCRADLEAVVAVATVGDGIAAHVRRGPDAAEHEAWVTEVAGATGLDVATVRWGAKVWSTALGSRAASLRPPTAATELPDAATRLPDHHEQATAAQALAGPRGAAPAATDRTPDDGTRTTGTRARRLVGAASIAVAALLLVAIGAFAWLQRDEVASTTTSTTTTSAPERTSSTTTTTTPVVTEWASTTPPSAAQQRLLDQMPEMFTNADTCRPITDDEFDALGTYPQGPDEASIECFYPDDQTIVYSLFADDAAMEAFFSDRLGGRGLTRNEGQIGPVPPWQLDYADDPERGSGSIFGYQRTGAGARSEVGFIREGLSTYAYSYQLGTDYEAYYDWWAEIFGGPARLD